MSKSVLGRGLGHLLKRPAEQTSAQDSHGPNAPTQENLSPGVGVLLHPHSNGSQLPKTSTKPTFAARQYWPTIKWVLWGTDLLLVALSSLLLAQSPWPPYPTAILCLIGFLAAAFLGIIALVGDRFL